MASIAIKNGFSKSSFWIKNGNEICQIWGFVSYFKTLDQILAGLRYNYGPIDLQGILPPGALEEKHMQ